MPTPRPLARPALPARLLFALPLVGTIARDISRSVDNVFYALMIFVTLLVLAVSTWGLVALTMTALVAVPVIFVLLFFITRG